jgi:membrane protease YdiL (CAAX protease family)
VPLIEELFFRDYLLERLDFGGRAGTLLAVAISTGIFAALHGRWLLAVAAGLVFCALRLRRGGRLADAVICHVAANTGVAAVAWATGNWQLI